MLTTNGKIGIFQNGCAQNVRGREGVVDGHAGAVKDREMRCIHSTKATALRCVYAVKRREGAAL